MSRVPRPDALNVAIMPIEDVFVVLCPVPVQLISDSTNGVAFATTLMKAVLTAPWVRDRGDGSLAAIARAGRAAGVPVLMPVVPGELGQSYFKDGFHLNQRGAEIFTARLLEALKEIPGDGLVGVEAMRNLRCSRSDPAVQC